MEELQQESTASAEKDSVHREHRSEHHHSHKRFKKKSKVKRFYKKHKSLIINVIVISVAIIAVLVMGLYGDRLNVLGTPPGPQNPASTVPSEMEGIVTTIQTEVSHFSKSVLLVPSAVHSFVNRDMSAPLLTVIDRYKEKDARLDLGLPVTLSYRVSSVPSGLSVKGTTLEVADNLNFTQSRVFTSSEDAAAVPIYHLQTGKVYYYRVGVTLSDNTTTYTIGTFETEESPRILTIGGIVNARDVGGWKTADGKTVRQGLFYRGSELDGAVEPAFKLNASGLNDMLTVLGIRTEMDLRSQKENALGISPLGANVQHIYYGVGSYSDIFAEASYESVRQVFSDLADPGRYPVYMHCTYGADRTGTMCYLLLNLLGVSEEEALREYELSALYYGWADTNSMNTFICDFQAFPGETMQKKAEYYLLAIGVTEQEIASIRAILLEQ